MRLPGAAAQADADLAELYQQRGAVETAIERLAAVPEEELREAALRLSLDHPGIGSIGYLLNLSDRDRQALLIGLLPEDDRRAFAVRLLRRIGDDNRIYRALGMVLPSSFPPPATAPIDRLPEAEPEMQALEIRLVPEAEPVDPLLARLLIHLREEHLSEDVRRITPFARPVSADLAGISIGENPQMQVELTDEGRLRIRGSNSEGLDQMFRKVGRRFRIRDGADLSLEDGSHLYAEIFGNPYRWLDGSWQSQLSTWLWSRSGNIRFWVGFSEGGLPHIDNLAITTSQLSGLAGIHIPSDLTITLLKKSFQHPGAFQVLQAGPRPLDDEERSRMANLSVALICTMALPSPKLFYGLMMLWRFVR